MPTALASSVARSVPLPRSLTRGDRAMTTHGLHPKVVVICSTGSRSQRNAARKTRPAIHPNTSPTEMPGCRVPSATCRRRLTEVRADKPSAVSATSPDVPNAISVTAERASTDSNVSVHRLPPIFSPRPGARAGAGRAATVTSWIAATTGSSAPTSSPRSAPRGGSGGESGFFDCRPRGPRVHSRRFSPRQFPRRRWWRHKQKGGSQ